MDMVEQNFKKEVGDVSAWCSEQYDAYFSPYLGNLKSLYETLQTERSNMSDTDLESVLTYLPLQIIEVSEVLSQYKLNNDCLKLHIKRIEADVIRNSKEKTVKERQEAAVRATMEYRTLSCAYTAIINRAENEINFGREFIMTVKKIWDARMKTYEANPISEGIDSLEVYGDE